MPYVVPARWITGLVPWWLPAVALCLVGCAKAPPPLPLVPSIDAGTIEGTVTDFVGVFIPGAEITVTSDATRQARTGYADTEGRYNVPALGPGSYTVEAVSDGFKRATRRGVQVERGRNVRIDLILEVGELIEIKHPIGRYRDPARARR